MSHRRARDFIYEWVVSLWIVWLLLGGTVYGVTMRLLHGPAHPTPAQLVNATDRDSPATR